MAEGPRLVIVGATKPVLNYVTACITVFNEGSEELLLRARGEAINVAVEVVQLLRRRFMDDVQISNVEIDGEIITARDGRRLNLPVLEITLSKIRK